MTISSYNDSHQKAFTLIELLVAISVFMVVIMISLGSVLSILDAGRKARSLKSVMTNLNFTTEVMSREIKFGDNYYCGVNTNSTWSPLSCTGNPNAPASGITFITSEGVDTIYRLNGSQIEKSIDHGATFIGVTSPEVTVQDLKFYVFGAASGDLFQPRVLMIVRGYAGSKQTTQSSFILQTVISQRALDS